MSLDICTLNDVKTRLGHDLAGDEHDTALTSVIEGIQGIFENECQRKLFIPAADVTEYYTGQSDMLMVKRYPIVSVTSIKEAYDYDFDNADALTENDNFRILNGGKSGVIKRIHTRWQSQDDGIQIIYSGGFCAAGVEPEAGETALPSDLREAAIEQASFIYKRKDDIGLSAQSFGDASMSKFSRIELLPMVKAILKDHRRPML